jgi:hypothetical protein
LARYCRGTDLEAEGSRIACSPSRVMRSGDTAQKERPRGTDKHSAVRFGRGSPVVLPDQVGFPILCDANHQDIAVCPEPLNQFPSPGMVVLSLVNLRPHVNDGLVRPFTRQACAARSRRAFRDRTGRCRGHCDLRLIGGPYAEAAHIRPHGRPHSGPDTYDNLICLCPNHHPLFDFGGFLVADDLSLIGIDGSLHMHPMHTLNGAHLKYYRDHYSAEE